MNKVAALYIDENGIYPSLVDSYYGVTKDAKTYNGPYPIVAHPPCGQWGRLRAFAKSNDAEKECAIRAVQQIREWGGCWSIQKVAFCGKSSDCQNQHMARLLLLEKKWS